LANENPGTAAKPSKQKVASEDRGVEIKQSPETLARLDSWFTDAKFGVFIHFGVYSALEGEYKGRGTNHNYSEWIMHTAEIPAKEYHEIAAGFNPTGFNAEEWVKTFKNCGARYVVITAKHHDGFVLYNSEVSAYNIVDHTPFKRDIVKELEEATHRHGLKFGVYYSHAQDWDEPDAPYLNNKTRLEQLHPELQADFKPDMDRYIMKKSLPQVEELVKNYKIDLIWFDTPSGINLKRAHLFYDVVRKFRPDCIINSRIMYGGKLKDTPEYLALFDYSSLRDKEVPKTKLPIYFESPDSVSSSFGYKTKGKYYYHSPKEMLHRFVQIVCSGGNHLINNGPMGNGKLDPEAVRIYGVMGEWLKVNGESIYGTVRNPLGEKPEWGNLSASKDGKTVYLHILEWPKSATITVKGLGAKATAAVYLANGEKASFSQDGDSLTVTLPAKPVNEYDTVVKLTL
jgi:alpha-L-fucosidase